MLCSTRKGWTRRRWKTPCNAIPVADTLIVGGTSLAVYPAAGLLRYFHGENLVVINKQPTPADAMANLLFPRQSAARWTPKHPVEV